MCALEDPEDSEIITKKLSNVKFFNVLDSHPRVTEFLVQYTQLYGSMYKYIKTVVTLGYKFYSTIECPIHGQWTAESKTVLSKGCLKCYKETSPRLSKRTMTLDTLVERANKVHEGRYSYENIVVRGGKSYVTITCAEHGPWLCSTRNHLNGSGCPACAKGGPSIVRYNFEDYVRRATEIHQNKYKYISLDYETVIASTGRKYKKTFLNCICDIHGGLKILASDHLLGKACSKCKNAETGVNSRYTLEQYQSKANEIHNNLYTYLSLNYSPQGSPRAEVVCSKHGMWDVDAHAHLAGSRCPMCSNRISAPQLEILEFLQSLGIKAEKEKKLGSSQKIWDILVESKKLVIEYDGLYWHSSKFKEPASQIDKFRIANAQGYRQINIFEDEWSDKKDIVKSILATALGANNSTRVFARNCSISEIPSIRAKEFMNKNHIQGFKGTSSYVGLIHGGSIVAVLGYELRESGRGKKESKEFLEITRYASECMVVGGFSKLLSYLIESNTNVKLIYTFSDNRLFTGETYKKCGFECVSNLPHDYCYIEKHSGKFSRVNKANYQKEKFLAKGLLYDPSLTEFQLADLNELYRLYDCGKKKWELKIK